MVAAIYNICRGREEQTATTHHFGKKIAILRSFYLVSDIYCIYKDMPQSISGVLLGLCYIRLKSSKQRHVMIECSF